VLLLEPHQAAANLALLAAAQLGKLAVDRLLLMRSLGRAPAVLAGELAHNPGMIASGPRIRW